MWSAFMIIIVEITKMCVCFRGEAGAGAGEESKVGGFDWSTAGDWEGEQELSTWTRLALKRYKDPSCQQRMSSLFYEFTYNVLC